MGRLFFCWLANHGSGMEQTTQPFSMEGFLSFFLIILILPFSSTPFLSPSSTKAYIFFESLGRARPIKVMALGICNLEDTPYMHPLCIDQTYIQKVALTYAYRFISIDSLIIKSRRLLAGRLTYHSLTNSSSALEPTQVALFYSSSFQVSTCISCVSFIPFSKVFADEEPGKFC